MTPKKTINNIEMIEISPTNIKNSVKCIGINLMSSKIEKFKEEKEDKLEFNLEIWSENPEVACFLHVKLNHSEDVEEFMDAYFRDFEFTIQALFEGPEDISNEDLIQFAIDNSLGILWPYAMEYATDQMKRVGFKKFYFPVINYVEVTDQLIENNILYVHDMDKIYEKNNSKRSSKKR